MSSTPSFQRSSSWILDFDDEDEVGIDHWESPSIIAAEEAKEATTTIQNMSLLLETEKETCARFTESMKGHMTEMTTLLGKVEPDTATREELRRLSILDEEIKRLKAEIHDSKSKSRSYTSEMIRASSAVKSFELATRRKERDIRNAIQMIRDAETVDLAFLLDCTGSMDSHIKAAKEAIQEVVRIVKRSNPDLNLRVAVVGYRDVSDSKRFEVLDFTASVKDFENFVADLKAFGGGDAPEDIAGAMQKANGLSWEQVSRVTFLIADCPCHGTRFHNGMNDDYPDGTPDISIESELKSLVSKGGPAGMQLHFGRITHHTDKMILEFDDTILTKGQKFEAWDINNPDKLISSVTSSVRSSISKSVSASEGVGVDDEEDDADSVSDYLICEAKPSTAEWDSIKPQAASLLCNKPVKSVKDLKAPLHFGVVRWGSSNSSETEKEKRIMIRRAKNPFAKGGTRLAYYAKLGDVDKDSSTPSLGTTGVSCSGSKRDKILKTFKKTKPEKEYLIQMEVSTIAHFLAEEYNQNCRPDHCPEVHFLSVNVLKMSDTELYCVEDQLPRAATNFTKYSNNTGYWNEDELHQTLLLFTQFTFETTGGYLMATDLQGVRDGHTFLLTDPAILCKDKTRFGSTNLGATLMDKCIQTTAERLKEYE